MTTTTTTTLLNADPPTVVEVEEGGGSNNNKDTSTTTTTTTTTSVLEIKRGGELPLSLFELLLTAFRRTLVICKTEGREEEVRSMDIGWPTEVRHVAHVTFDRFRGFLGVPDELEPEVPRRAPSASTTAFGVSTGSMQCSYDSRGNSVPTILLMLQRRLYAQGGLQAEGIFRIAAENSEEELLRDQINRGVVPDDIDVHCLAGLIKAWFRELPDGVLDSLIPEQVMQCQSEEDYVQLVGLLPSAESALLDWAVNLMADVVEEEHHNKMNEHGVATVFAPNMTQMEDPLNALVHAVQVMNFLKTMIQKVLRERHESATEGSTASSSSHSGPPNEHGHSISPRISVRAVEENDDGKRASAIKEEPLVKPLETNSEADVTTDSLRSFHRRTKSSDLECLFTTERPCKPTHKHSISGPEAAPALPKPRIHVNSRRKKTTACQSQPLNLDLKKLPRRLKVDSALQPPPPPPPPPPDKPKRASSTLSVINTRAEREEAGR